MFKPVRPLILCALLAATAHAGALFSLSGQGFASAGQYTITLDDSAFAMNPGEVTDLPLPGTPYRVVLDRIETHPNGDRTWIGHLEGSANDYRVMLTRGAATAGVYGRILTPTGQYQVAPVSGNAFAADGTAELTDLRAGGWQRGLSPFSDALTPPADPAPATPLIDNTPQSHQAIGTPANATALGDGQFAAGETVIDVMVLYTPDLTKRYGSAETLVNSLVALANQAYIDSEISQRIRVVKVQEVNYTVLNSNSTALNALTNSTDAAFSGVATLRTEVGADLVSLLRPYERTSAQGCGIAWVGGSGGSAITTNTSRFGFSVVSYGNDISGSRFYCDDYTFAHELGHNMGGTHDRANSSSSGAFSYSYGYGLSGTFGTIMSYIDPVIGKFSNPAISCKGSPCGVANSEDNARTFNNTRTSIANYRSTVVVDTPSDSERIFNWAQSTYPQFLSPANSNSLSTSGYTYRFYSSTATYLGIKDSHLYFLDGATGSFSDLGLTAPYLDSAKQAGF